MMQKEMISTDRLKSLLESFIFVSESPVTSQQAFKALQGFFQKENNNEESENNSEEKLAEESVKGEALLEKTGEENLEAQQGIEEVDTEKSPELILLEASEPSDAQEIQEEDLLTLSFVKNLFKEIQEAYAQNEYRGIELVELAGAWQFRTRAENADFLRSVYQPKPTKLSKPALETLAIIAYKQPLTRSEIDEVRGVDSGGVLKKLLEKNLIRMMGKKEEAGKPVLYGTTSAFLELFQLSSLKDLPSLRDYSELEEEFFQAQLDSNQSDQDKSSEAKLSDLFGGSSLSQLEELSQEENEVLDELEANLKDLRKVEKSVFPPEADDEESSQIASQETSNPAPENSTEQNKSQSEVVKSDIESEMNALLEASESSQDQSESA